MRGHEILLGPLLVRLASQALFPEKGVFVKWVVPSGEVAQSIEIFRRKFLPKSRNVPEILFKYESHHIDTIGPWLGYDRNRSKVSRVYYKINTYTGIVMTIEVQEIDYGE